MSLPNTRDELKEYCLRKLGKPVININVADSQLEDRIDEAIRIFQDNHMEGSELTYLKHQVTDSDKTNGYISVANNVLTISRVFSINDTSTSSQDLFNINYQWSLNNIHDLSSQMMTDYVLSMRHIAMINEFINGLQSIRFNRYSNKLYIDMEWDNISTGTYLIAEAYILSDPSSYSRIYSDEFLIRYTTALFKKQWGENMKKFQGIELPGGLQFSGQQIYDEAVTELQELEERLRDKYELPPQFIVG
jgi:hypothetical protein